MITRLNLATNPFRNRTTPLLLALLLLLVALIGALYSITRLYQNHKLLELSKQQREEMQAKVDELKGEGQKVRQNLTPEQQQLLIASHKLVANKAFGWSRLFADLENVLPGNVSASRISIENVYKDGDRIKAELDLGVLSRNYESVHAMIDNMNNSGVFQAELRSQDLQKTERMTYTEYTLYVIYTPAYGYAPVQNSDVASSEGGSN